MHFPEPVPCTSACRRSFSGGTWGGVDKYQNKSLKNKTYPLYFMYK
jgi:hypothetical protein